MNVGFAKDGSKNKKVYIDAAYLADGTWDVYMIPPYYSCLKTGLPSSVAAEKWAHDNGYEIAFVAEMHNKKNIEKVSDYESACKRFGVKRI